MEESEECWEYEGYPRGITVEPGNDGCVEIAIQYVERWGDEYQDIVLPRDKAIEMANHILGLCNTVEPKSASGMDAEQVKKYFPEWVDVKERIWEQYQGLKWFNGVGICANGVHVLVFSEEDTKFIPKEIDGVKITVEASGGIYPL